ncbi:MAG TPA: hypothetical protein VFW33_14290, partial [Gemmataceae bacterium]|nr:hypothetical protein [Gemmataceae bacterium]
EAVEQARALPPDQLPRQAEREQDVPQANMVSGVLTAVLGDFCAREQLASNLVSSSADVKNLVRARFQGTAMADDSPLSQGWRREHVLPALLAVLEGRRAVRVADVRAEAPFAYVDGEPPAGR